MQPVKPVTDDDKLFYFERHFFTLDGLWILETEHETSLETALAIDLRVWVRLLEIAYRRIKDRLQADTARVDGIVDVLAFRWSCEGWGYSIEHATRDAASITVHRCPYKEIMARNPDRHAVIPRVCKDICIPIYDAAVRSLNPAVRLSRDAFQGLGDTACSFHLALQP